MVVPRGVCPRLCGCVFLPNASDHLPFVQKSHTNEVTQKNGVSNLQNPPTPKSPRLFVCACAPLPLLPPPLPPASLGDAVFTFIFVGLAYSFCAGVGKRIIQSTNRRRAGEGSQMVAAAPTLMALGGCTYDMYVRSSIREMPSCWRRGDDVDSFLSFFLGPKAFQ